MKIISLVFLTNLLLFAGPSFGQTLEEFIMNDIYFDSAQLVKQDIRSVHAYVEQVHTRRDRPAEFHVSKFLDMEWNSNGQVTYKRFLSKSAKGGALGADKTFYARYEFDEKHRLIKDCNSTGIDSNCTYLKYNNDGHIVSKKETHSDQQFNTYEYTWRNGEVVDLKFTEKIKWVNRDSPEIKFDKKGNITAYIYREDSFLRAVKEVGNIKTKEWKHVRNDSIIRHNTYSVSIDKNQFLSNCQMNIEGDTNKLVEASYDPFGNISFLLIKEWETPNEEGADSEFNLHNEKTYVDERSYEFKNFYTNDLLYKRTITEHHANWSVKGKTVTQRFHLEKEELEHKYWPQKREFERDEYQRHTEMEVIPDVEVVHPNPPAVKEIPESEPDVDLPPPAPLKKEAEIEEIDD